MNEYLSLLSRLIDERQNQIIDRWKVAASQLPRAQHLDEPLLLDHMPQLLHELSAALTQAQSLSIIEMRAYNYAREHGAIRFKLGFDIEEVIAEFGLLRDVIQEFAEASGVNISGEVNRTVNRVIDKVIAVSLETYVRQQAEEVERKRREYLSFVVHDLKTPISAVITAAQVIERKLAVMPSPVVNTMLEIVRRNAARMDSRVMEIINEASRLQALTANSHELPLNLRDVDLWPLAERLKQDCQSIAESQNNKISNELPHNLRIYADPDLLLEALHNLMSNALKYTTNGEIVIGGEENAESVVCWVKDTGIGIPADRIGRIFQEGTADPKVVGSTGLGLSIVDKVMQLHRGRASVESSEGAGSTFRIEFPKAQNKAA